jgi:UDP:flavonoid glycosyltransferase YjiC (YdhE family)
MKLLLASTPAPGHLEPILSLANIAMARGDEAICLTGAHLADSVHAAGVRFAPLPPSAGLDFRKMEEIYPELVSMPPGPERIRFSFERAFLDPMPAQAEALRELIDQEKPDVVVTDSAFYGRVPLFVDRSTARPPFAGLGFSFLCLTRPDGAPLGLGFPPASTDEERAHYAEIGAGVDAMVTEPIRRYLDEKLIDMGVPALNLPPWDAMVLTNDLYLQPTTPEFEYPFSPTPELVRFIGVLPSLPRKGAVPPEWWHEIDEGRPVVLVTQGTWANFDFGELVEPALEALSDRQDVLVLVTTGGRPVESVKHANAPNVRVAEFLDYSALLPRLSLLITNGGYRTVSLALKAGVPVVASGRTEDRAEVGARVAWSGVGLQVPSAQPSAAELREAITRVMAEPSFRERARRVSASLAAINTPKEILARLDDLVTRSNGLGRSPWNVLP